MNVSEAIKAKSKTKLTDWDMDKRNILSNRSSYFKITKTEASVLPSQHSKSIPPLTYPTK